MEDFYQALISKYHNTMHAVVYNFNYLTKTSASLQTFYGN